MNTVFENQRKSLILYCKRSRVDKSSLQMPKMVKFGEFLKIWNLRSNSVTRQVNYAKIKNSNATLGVIFKRCDNVWLLWYFGDQNNFFYNISITVKYINLFHLFHNIWKKNWKIFFASFGVTNKWNPHAHFFRIAPFTLKSTSLKSHGNIRIFPVRNWTPPHEW